MLLFTRRDEVGKCVLKHSRTQNRLGMLFFKLRKLTPVGAPLLEEKAKLLYFVICVTSTSFLVNLRALNEKLLDCERKCICYDQRQNMLKRNWMSPFFKIRPQFHARTMKTPRKLGIRDCFTWHRILPLLPNFSPFPHINQSPMRRHHNSVLSCNFYSSQKARITQAVSGRGMKVAGYSPYNADVNV